MGVFVKHFFGSRDYFSSINDQHQFQSLTESNKEGIAHRKGIYLTRIKQRQDDKLDFKLLRCSSNFGGPSDNFRSADDEIIGRTSALCEQFYEQKTELNHVLAQIYYNSTKGKATIKTHTDKTKDMPTNAVIAFCTFYDPKSFDKRVKPSETDPFDLCYNETSVLTKLVFRLKPMVKDIRLPKEFVVTLYPNSIFMIPLSTNRMYTHEIKPSSLPFDKIPIRMGYVIRCSKTDATFDLRENQTYINENGTLTKLVSVNDADLRGLRQLYFEENTTDKMIQYMDINFSMNKGDYIRPIL